MESYYAGSETDKMLGTNDPTRITEKVGSTSVLNIIEEAETEALYEQGKERCYNLSDADELLGTKNHASIMERVMASNWDGFYEALCSMLVKDVSEDRNDASSDAKPDYNSNDSSNDHIKLEIVSKIFPTARVAEFYATMARVDGIKLQDVNRRVIPSKREHWLEWICDKQKVEKCQAQSNLSKHTKVEYSILHPLSSSLKQTLQRSLNTWGLVRPFSVGRPVEVQTKVSVTRVT